jgi:hypothetical protein
MNIFVSLFLTLLTTFAWGHGEDNPGPHGGHIKMPGAFHTEVVPGKNGSFDLYLININFQNPSVVNSSVETRILIGKAETTVACNTVEKTHFHCQAAGDSLKKGRLLIKASREGAVGTEVEYSLPFKKFKQRKK